MEWFFFIHFSYGWFASHMNGAVLPGLLDFQGSNHKQSQSHLLTFHSLVFISTPPGGGCLHLGHHFDWCYTEYLLVLILTVSKGEINLTDSVCYKIPSLAFVCGLLLQVFLFQPFIHISSLTRSIQVKIFRICYRLFWEK